MRLIAIKNKNLIKKLHKIRNEHHDIKQCLSLTCSMCNLLVKPKDNHYSYLISPDNLNIYYLVGCDLCKKNINKYIVNLDESHCNMLHFNVELHHLKKYVPSKYRYMFSSFML